MSRACAGHGDSGCEQLQHNGYRNRHVSSCVTCMQSSVINLNKRKCISSGGSRGKSNVLKQLVKRN